MARKMKDSGIEWIGEIPEGWEITKIKHIVSSVTDTDHFMPDSAEFGIPYLMIGDLKDLSSSIDWDSSKKISIEDYKKLSIKSRPQIGDIIFARYASIGTTCYIDTDRDFLVSYACLTIHPSDLIIGKFLSYYLKSSSFAEDVLRRTNSNTQGNVGKDSLVNATIVLPSIIEQTQIVNFLDAKCSDINAMLSKTRSSIEEYKKLKQAVITQAVTKGVRGEREIKESKLPWASKIPKAWNICAIRHIMFECKERTKDGHEEQLSVTQQFGIIKSSDASIANPSLSLDDWRIVAIGDIVFNKYKAHSGVFFVSPFSGIVTFNYSVYRCFPNCYAKYFEYQYKTHGCISEFRTRMHGVGNSISPLYTKDLMKIKVVCPPLDEQKEIANYLDAKCAEIDRLIAKKEQLVKELESYKKSLIYEVVTGKREV